MRPEAFPRQPAPPAPESAEISLSQLLSQTVETLFAQQPIAKVYQNTDLDKAALETFIQERKKKLFLELLVTSRLEMVRFLTDLNEMKGRPVTGNLLSVSENGDPERPTI